MSRYVSKEKPWSSIWTGWLTREVRLWKSRSRSWLTRGLPRGLHCRLRICSQVEMPMMVDCLRGRSYSIEILHFFSSAPDEKVPDVRFQWQLQCLGCWHCWRYLNWGYWHSWGRLTLYCRYAHVSVETVEGVHQTVKLVWDLLHNSILPNGTVS
jgi:hypothetical protein